MAAMLDEKDKKEFREKNDDHHMDLVDDTNVLLATSRLCVV